jgi:cyclopropane fatty-acyl-phospholipid synthase-like methyltransferase
MTQPSREFYSILSVQYAERIRQLVPKYDAMVECILRLVALRRPCRILDIGAGTGLVMAHLLTDLPDATVTALEPCTAMASAARAVLSSFGERAAIVETDVHDFTPDVSFEVIVSNLVLHNFELDEKANLLRRIRAWLSENGAFVWGDFVRHENAQLDDYFTSYRVGFAHAAGCPTPIIEANFGKEGTVDRPLTTPETIDLILGSGFQSCDIVWAHDTFAVFFSA